MDVPYFMDQCTLWELNDMIDYIPYIDRSLWESQRLNAYATVQVNSRKKISQQDICQFKWEDKDIDEYVKDESKTKITDAEIQRLKNIAKQWEK